MRETLLVIYYDFLANCCFYSGCILFYSGCILNRIGHCLYWLLARTYGASAKLFDEATRLYSLR